MKLNFTALFFLSLFTTVDTGFAQMRVAGPAAPIALIALMAASKKNKKNAPNNPNAVPKNVNELSNEERREGWQLLFDGKSLNGWHTYNKTFIDGKWEVNNGTIHLLDRDMGGLATSHDLVTNEDYGDFDLRAEWKVAQGANSGVMIHVQEGIYDQTYKTGLEMQVLDNNGNPNGQQPACRAGALFGLIPCTPDNARPPGQWNEIEIICQNGILKFFQNGVNVVTTTLWDNNWKTLVAGSGHGQFADYGTARFGKINLQDGAGEVWFTNIKIKKLDAANSNSGNSIAQGAQPQSQPPRPQTNSAQGGYQSPNNGQAQGGSPKPSSYNGVDLSGIWEGQQTNGNLVMYYQIGLVRTGDYTYTGFDSCRWVRNSDNSPLNSKGPLPHAKKIFVATFDKGVLSCSELGNMQNSNWGAGGELFKLSNANGTPQFVNGDANQPDRHFSLKHSGQPMPDEFLPYLLYDSTLQIENIAFHNSHDRSDLRYNDHGRFVVSVKNGALASLSKMSVSIVTGSDEAQNGIQGYDRMNHTEVQIPAGGHTDLSIPIATNFSVPAGSLHFSIELFSGNKVFAHKDVVVATDPFFKTDNASLPEASNPRIKAVDNYFGAFNTPYGEVAAPLNALAASGDKLAAMWKAIFMYKGFGGYKIDQTQAIALAKGILGKVENDAREGSAEALYLMFYACQLDFEGRNAIPYAEKFLQRAADAGFKPAVYDFATLAHRKKNYETAFSYFERSFNMGAKKAASNIGTLYEGGNGPDKDLDSAVAWYRKGIVFGDPAAMVNMAMLWSAGFGDTPPDVDKALELTGRAADKNYTPAMIFAGNVYFNGRQGKPQNIPTAIKWFKRAADLGDENGMLRLGIAYLAENIPGAARDEASAFFWIKKAAEAGDPTAMKVLANFYNEGKVAEKNIIRGRYWYNQAVLRGVARQERKDIDAAQEDASNFWANADFSPSYVYVNEYHDVVGDSGPDFFGGMIGGLFGAAMERYSHIQEEINGLEFIQQKNGYKIYGGTVSGYFISTLNLKPGQTVSIKAYGIISTGMMSGSANADGLGNNWAEYRIVQNIPCSAVMAGVKDSNWQFIGQSANYTAPKDGPLVFALNAIDYRNYKGYFDIVVELPVN